MTEDLTHPLAVLARAVAFKNLSSASLHVGLSQPQLSRLVAKLEKELGLELLNRLARRHSTWTPQAHQLAELYSQHQRRFELSLRGLQTASKPRQIHIGTLEGLAPVAMDLAKRAFEKAELELVGLDVFDRAELESKFLAGDLDLILNTRVPSRNKPRFLKVCGFQTLETRDSGSAGFQLYSTFEYATRRRRAPRARRTLVSNSLFVRREWLDRFGGRGSLPSEVLPKFKKGMDEILVMAGDWLDVKLWELLVSAFA